MLTAMEELNSKLNTVLNNQRVILRHLQVGACGPTNDDIPEGIILPQASMDQLDQLETHLLDPAVERLIETMRLADSLNTFKSQLKTHYFKLAYNL